MTQLMLKCSYRLTAAVTQSVTNSKTELRKGKPTWCTTYS